MSCEFCDLDRITSRDDFDPHADYLVGEWCFTKDDDMTHRASGRIGLWYDFDEDGWALVVLVDDEGAKSIMPAVVQFRPKVCPMCGRKL